MKKFLAWGSCLCVLGLSQGWAQSYPAKPIQMMISSTPGAGTDLSGRTVAERLSERLGVPVVVTNNGGAAGLIAADIFKRASPDGYSIMATNDNQVLMVALEIGRAHV